MSPQSTSSRNLNSKCKLSAALTSPVNHSNTKENIIHINLDKARVTTVPHEIFHSVLISKLQTEPAIAKAAVTMMEAVRKSLPKNSAIVQRIDKFSKQDLISIVKDLLGQSLESVCVVFEGRLEFVVT